MSRRFLLTFPQPVQLLLGLVLGDMVEQNYHRVLMISGGYYSIFFLLIVVKVLMLLTLLSLIGPSLGKA